MSINNNIKMKILCWNIAGIRASLKRDDFDFLLDSDYNIICIQETKATREQGEKALSDELKAKYMLSLIHI